MSWFLNKYRCDRCGRRWADEWSCTCDDDCPHCGARHWSPYDSDDLTEVIVSREGGGFAVLRSSENAEHDPEYADVAHFATKSEAEAFLAAAGRSD